MTPGGKFYQVMLAVFTDLDGTLLDHDTYDYAPALPAIAELKRRGYPLVLTTSKTRAETARLHAALGLDSPFIFENGGGISNGGAVIPLGARRATLIEALAHASRVSGIRVLGFSAMSVADIARATGLAAPDAALAAEREFSEPFSIPDPGGAPRLLGAIEDSGFEWTQGGRFYHILAGNDKARAVRLLIDGFRRDHPEIVTIGLGDGLNDEGFLREVDRPIVLRSAQSEALLRRVPHAVLTPGRGPAAWNSAVLSCLASSARSLS